MTDNDIVLVHRPFTPSDKQLRVLAARAAGGSRKDAARILEISESTVAYHLRLILVGGACADDAQAVFKYRHEIAALVKV